MEATKSLSKRPIWRCKQSQCKYFDKDESAKVKKPYPAYCPGCSSKIMDFCNKCKVFHNHESFYHHCVKVTNNRLEVTRSNKLC